jgi:hypothetical protein
VTMEAIVGKTLVVKQRKQIVGKKFVPKQVNPKVTRTIPQPTWTNIWPKNLESLRLARLFVVFLRSMVHFMGFYGVPKRGQTRIVHG